jgi:lambda family phage portal protein
MTTRRRTDRTPRVRVGPPAPRAPQGVSVLPSGAWDGARNDLRELRNFTPGQGSAISDNIGDLPYLRNRVRDLLRNAPLASGARQTVRMGVIGAGLALSPRVMRGILERRAAMTTEQMDRFEQDAAELWWAWSDSTGCDIEASRRFRALSAQVFTSAWTDGDMLVIRRHVPRPDDVLSLKLQLIEADRLSTPDHLKHDPRVIDGIERDDNGVAVAYYIEDVHPGERFIRPGARTWTRQEAFVQGIRRMLHVRNLSSEDRIGAVRGLPSLAPVIVLLKQLARYSNAELARNVVASFFTVFIEQESGASASGSGLAPIDPNSTPDNAWEYKLDSAAVVEVEPGKKIQLASPPGPTATFDPFTNALIRQMGAAINIPYELIVRHFSSSYSASRAAVNFAYEAFAVMRGWVEDDFVAPVYGWFLHEAVASGMLEAPGFLEEPLIRRAFSNFRLTGPVAPQLDPLKEALAAKELVNGLLSTREEETAKVTGGDWNDNLGQLKKEREQIQDAGLDIEPVAERIRTEPIQPQPPDDVDPTAPAPREARRALLRRLLADDLELAEVLT